MRKKIIVNENQQNLLKLPKFIYKAIMGKYTSLGDNPALPSYGEFGFEYEMVKTKFIELNDTINEMMESGVIETNDPDYLISYLGRLITKCRKIEKPLRPQLEKLCENILNATLAIPTDTVLLKCKLVDKIQPKHDIRIMPEGGDNSVYSFEDVDEIELTNKVILKRRFINALIQGFSYKYSNMLDEWTDTINGLNNELLELWDKIRVLNDYLLYVKEEKISDDNNMQTSYVEVHLGKQWKKTMITSQGIIFPYLLKETFKGFFELFSSHGLPEDNEKAMYVIRKSDFLVAEPWDMRLGIPIVDRLDNVFKGYDNDIMVNTTMIPYFFTRLSELSIDVFNDVMKNLLAATNKGGRLLGQIYDGIIHDVEYQEFKDKISQKNIDTSLIMDDCFTSEELDDYVLSENSENEMMAYHGTGADFNKFNHKKYLSSGAGSQVFGWGTYITNDPGIAEGYADSAKNLPFHDLISSTAETCEKLIRYYVEECGLEDFEAKNHAEFITRYLNNDGNDNFIKSYFKTRIKEMPSEKDFFQMHINAIESLYKPTFIYEVDIPDDNGFNYIDWFAKIQRDQLIEIIECFYHDLKPSYRQYMRQGWGSHLYDFYTKTEEDMMIMARGDGYYADMPLPTGKEIYVYLSTMFKSDKAASLFLLHCGFDGIKYKAGTHYGYGNVTVDNPTNYVIFNSNKIKIINKNIHEKKENKHPLIVSEKIGYHGTAADFERFNHRYFLDTGSGSQTFGWGSYITNDEGIAKGYADSARRNTMNYTEIWDFIRDFLKDKYNFTRPGRAATYITKNLEYYSWDELLAYIEKNCLSTKLSEDEVEAYLSALRAYESIREKVYIYEVDIPEDKGYNYIDWFNPILPRQAEMIMRGLRSLRPSLLNMMAKNNELFGEFYDNYINKAYNDNASFEESIELVCYESKFGDFTGIYDTDYPKGSILYYTLIHHTGSPKAASLFLAHCGFDGIKYKAGTIYGLDNASTKQPMNYVIFDANAIEIIEKKSV